MIWEVSSDAHSGEGHRNRREEVVYSVRSTIGVLINTYQIEPEAVCFAITAYGNGMKGSWLRTVHENQELTDMWLTFIVFRLLQPLDSDTDLAFSFSWVSKGDMAWSPIYQ